MIDQGFYKYELEQKQRNIGKLLENIVFLHLLRNGYIVTVCKTGNLEVDFIANKGDEHLYLQVCYELSDDCIIEGELNSL